MSLVIRLFNIGFVIDFLYVWLKSWSFAIIVGLPTFILVTHVVSKLVDEVIKN